MRRRAKAVKGQGHKALKRRKPSKGKTDRRPPTGAEVNIARLTRERDELLQQRAATSEVLRAISSSAGELEPVFQSVLENAVRICDAKFGTLFRFDGVSFHFAAGVGVPAKLADFERQRGPFQPPLGTLVDGVRQTKRLQHTADYSAEPVPGASARLGGARSTVCIPMLKGDALVGVFLIYRQEVRPFTARQIELLKNFAAQAVIAIENARLLNELRQRTDDLSESLKQQTATSEVLNVISSSRGELEPVFESILQNAKLICTAKFGTLWRFDEAVTKIISSSGIPSAFAKFLQRGDFRPGPLSPLSRVVQTRQYVHISDYSADPCYLERDPLAVAGVELAGIRTLLVVPLLKDDQLMGAIGIFRQEVRQFSEKQIALVSNFASQAVIAIENARLLNELRESLEQQTATSEVLKVISGSRGELAPVFDAMLENATRICEAKFGILFLTEGDAFRTVALYGAPTAFAEARQREPLVHAGPGISLRQAAITGQPVQVADIQAEPAYTEDPRRFAILKLAGARTVLSVPMLKDDGAVGVINIYSQEVRPFTDKQIELLKSFAAQAVIAIDNARLLNELRQRTADLSKSLEELRTTQDRLVQTQKLALLGQLTAGIAHEIKNPLNFVNNFSGISAELIDELRDTLKGVPLGDKARTEINELTDTLRSNFDKVVHHGRRADAIVKSMLQHSREGSGEHRVIDVNALVEESLNLAWHGARAETQGFEIKLRQFFDPSAGNADIFPQDIRRALLNVISNGFYAATMRRAQNNGGDYEPTLTASTKSLGDRVEISIRDNGTGMPPDVKEKMFNPFFTTKPTGEGTGLGLSISHDIIVKQHGGSIEVDTQPGEFTEIRVILPRNALFL